MKLELMHWLGIGIGAVLVGGSFFFLDGNVRVFALVVSSLFVVVPFMISFLLGQSKQHE